MPFLVKENIHITAATDIHQPEMQIFFTPSYCVFFYIFTALKELLLTYFILVKKTREIQLVW